MAKVRHLGLFPWCFNPTTAFFRGDTLRTSAVAMFWRVKKWGLDYTLEIRTNVEPPFVTFESETQYLDVTEQDAIAGNVGIIDELGLVCADKDHFWGLGTLAVPLVDSYLKAGPFFDLFFDRDDMVGAGVSGTGPIIGSVEVKIAGVGDGSFSIPIRAQFPEYLGSLYDLLSVEATLTAEDYWPYA